MYKYMYHNILWYVRRNDICIQYRVVVFVFAVVNIHPHAIQLISVNFEHEHAQS